jgi:hypothetical protein
MVSTQFKSVTSLGESLFSDALETNILAWVNWSLLQVGGFFNERFPSIGTHLRLVSDPDYVDGQVWEGYRKDWVWESGVAGTQQPIPISGAWVNNSFTPVGTGLKVDYQSGRMIFAEPRPLTSQVKTEFTFRQVQLMSADVEWFQELQFDTLDFDKEQVQFQEAASGAWNVLAQNRIQLPAVVIEAVSRVKMIPLQLGNNFREHQQEVLFHVLADKPFWRKQLHDVIVSQWAQQIFLFDKEAVEAADAWPLDWDGTLKANPRTYPALVAAVEEGGFRWKQMMFKDMRSEPQISFPPLYRCTIRATVSVDLP